jgi:band 4.1-like protein 1/2/3
VFIAAFSDKVDDTPTNKVTTRSYAPNSGKPMDVSGTPGKYKVIDDVSVAAKSIAKDGIDSNLDFIAKEAERSGIPFAKTTAPSKRRVKIMVITAKIDPKSKKIDATSKDATLDHSIGVINSDTGNVETKFGVVGVKSGKIVIINNTGEKETLQGTVDPKTNGIQFTSKVVNPTTGKLDETLGQIFYVSPLENAIVEIIGVSGNVLDNGKLDFSTANAEVSRGVLNSKTGSIDCKYGILNLLNNEITVVDPKTGKSTTKPIHYDETGQISVAEDDANRKLQIIIGQQIDPIVEVQSVSGKMDKNGLLDPKTLAVDGSSGQLDTDNMKINTKYGQFDLVKRTLAAADHKTGKMEVKDLKFDASSGQILLKNQVNPKTQKPDRDWVRLITMRIVNQKNHPRTGLIESDLLPNEEVKIDAKTNQIWMPVARDPKTRDIIYQSSLVDPMTGKVSHINGYLNPKTKEIERSSKLDPNLFKVDEKTGQIYVATGDIDESGEPIFAASQVNSENGEVYTKLAKADKAGKLVIIKIYIITKRDDQSGKPQEVDPNSCEIDPSGRIRSVTNTTVYVYKMVDPVTGEVTNVDPNDPRVAGARTTTTTVLTLSGIVKCYFNCNEKCKM